MEIKSNLFLIGAAKSGTTSLANYLNEHPDIFISDPKEPNYFAEELPDSYREIRDYPSYKSLFENAGDFKIIGEASTMYLPYTNSIERIIRYNENALFLVVIRNPIEMARSWHSHKLYYRNENIEDFEQAWMLQKKRESGLNIPRKCSVPFHLQYKEFCSVGTQLMNVLKLIERDRIHIILHDDLKKDPKSTMSEIFDFLELDRFKKDSFEKHNQNKQAKSKFLQNIVTRISPETSKTIKHLKNKMGLNNISPIKFLIKKNTIKTERTPLSTEFHRIISSAFESEIQLIEKITSRNLNHWRVT